MGARGLLVLLLVVAVGAAGVFAWLRRESAPPAVAGPTEILVGGEGREIVFELSDEGSGVRSASVVLAHSLGEETLHSESYGGGLLRGAAHGGEPVKLTVRIDPSKLPSPVEEAFLRISVRDWSWQDGLRGNETRLDLPVTIDREPPRISVATGLTYVRRGGAGVVVYSVGEETTRDGVEAGGIYFPGFPHGDRRVAFYAVATDAPKSPSIRVVARDRAGNVARARWPVRVNERELPRADVRLPASFLQRKVPDLAAAEGIDTDDLVAAFHRINVEVRQRNEDRIRELLAEPSPERLWQGPFEQLRNSQVTSRFAEQRRYLIDGSQASEATHFGYDLASTSASDITAAATGRVVFADELGIYGNCVLIDHGQGVASLYGHLSRLDVAAGDRVEKGDALGLSGSTGLAGGDHLHFAILVNGVYVDPLEWWDPKWVRENVEARLGSGGA